MSLNVPIEIRQRFVPITHSRVREAIDVIEERLYHACAQLRPVDLQVKVEQDGSVSLTLLIGNPIEHELTGDEAIKAVSRAFEEMRNRGTL